jgi:succinate dehydrogenase / fumarate reductase cytochrome b subunit
MIRLVTLGTPWRLVLLNKLMMHNNNNRPVYLNLLQIRQPVIAVVSILHRLSGVLLILCLPLLIYLFDLSLRNAAGFARVSALLHSGVAKGVGVVLVWVLAHHLLAGVRFLLLDFHVGVDRVSARRGAWLVHIGAALVTLLAVGALL